MLHNNFSLLPDVLIQKIINYTGVIAYRNGKYITRIPLNDYRYFVLKKIPKPIIIKPNRVLLKLLDGTIDTTPGYFIEYFFTLNSIKINVKYVYVERDGFDRYISTKSFEQII